MDKTTKKRMVTGLLFVALTIVFTVYGQLVLKWQISDAGELPDGIVEKVIFLGKQYFRPWIISGLIAAFLASGAWMAAMTQLELSFAYPFMSLAFVAVMLLSVALFNETLAWNKVLGTFIIIIGLIVIVR